jgi:hypothetical protein
MSEFFDEARWALFLAARRRRGTALDNGADEAQADVVFKEWFVQATERETVYVAQREVAALLGAMKIENGRVKWL